MKRALRTFVLAGLALAQALADATLALRRNLL